MSLPLPTSLTPSKVSSFKDCALAFRFSAIDRLPEPASPAAYKGTLVHRALQLLFWDEPAGSRSMAAAMAKLEQAWAEAQDDPEFVELSLTEADVTDFRADAELLVRRYFELEDPDQVQVIGTELRLEVEIGSLKLRGIIDRLELDSNGDLVVTDYKTGRSPGASFEQSRMGGVHFYAFLCEQVLGVRPVRIQLLHLREPVAISMVPSDQSIRGLQQRTQAIWSAVERACETDSFKPKPGRLCDWCSFKAYCPAFGGDPQGALDVVAARSTAGSTTSTAVAPHLSVAV
ncbi:MAG: RecB family exonuclease [uncultured Acidimicrobiales bacterium]|uniref:RecB family exonuclease n=1 Tax=uncultured Acidimicrobiales bacterium TaxID=310071 RepID=A0A6J4HNM9_9ACTN|nr:MAG: RecB family exonuclease [uncultured Acidimicrobiales bacterium]